MIKTILDPIKELSSVSEANRLLSQFKSVEMDGCIDAAKPGIITCLAEESRHKIVIAADEIRARDLKESLSYVYGGAVYYPPRDMIFYQSDLSGNQLNIERINAISSILNGSASVIITTFDALMEKGPGLSKINGHSLYFERDIDIDLDETAQSLLSLGYTRANEVETRGEFAVRGGILDIYPLTDDSPVRIELMGDTVESLRRFDALSQRSLEELSEAIILPASEIILSKSEISEGLKKLDEEYQERYSYFRQSMKTEEAFRLKEAVTSFKDSLLEFGDKSGLISYLQYFCPETHSFLDYFDPRMTTVFWDEPSRIIEKGMLIESEFKDSMSARLEQGYILPGQANVIYSTEEVFSKMSSHRIVYLSSLSQKLSLPTASHRFYLSVRPISSYHNSFDTLLSDLTKFKKNRYRIVIVSGSSSRARRLSQELNDNELTSFYTDDPERVPMNSEIITIYGALKTGYEYPDIHFVCLSDTDIFGIRSKKKEKRKSRNYEGEHISSFQDLSIGDYVIHEQHGIGIYSGIEHIEIDGVLRDYVKVSFQGGGNVYVIASNLNTLQKYASKDTEKKPKLNTLGSREWIKTRDKVRKAVGDIAKKLVELYARRQNGKGYACGPDTEWQREFEELFPFEETDDQLKAISDVKKDMESEKIMDRLICGDVGFGKTEIAIRAAFKACQESRQTAILVPTTILAEQHYNTFVERMKDYPINIGLLCRFRTRQEQAETAKKLASGEIDIVIGTHRLLSKDIKFHDLGLLVIDEEQRFGVTHKEKIKAMRANVDVISLTATPIPRTLHMSLVGIRDMSVLEEPPQDRMPIQTFVMEFSPEMVREAITREIARGGQIYYVNNRVHDIHDIAAKIQALVPDAAVSVAHGQMSERELENVMRDFINGEIDVLVATTIIETGIDIPNVNTIIIQNADKMGLSQLYQLRGRVGRSNRTAYAFLLYKRDSILKETAEKRLSAIREFTNLGSGFKIAMKDLEIRGAGNVLGAEQHGHMEAVGYDLYCKMLNIAVKTEMGQKTMPEFTTTIDISIDAYIPDSYTGNENLKLDLYRRIAGIDSDEEAEDMMAELKDRFGNCPDSVMNLIKIVLIKQKAHRVFVENLSEKRDRLEFVLNPNAEINPSMIPELVNKMGGKLSFRTKTKPMFIYELSNGEKDRIAVSNYVLDQMQILNS
ncbi:MAG: transcription-repair coupling factor [Lachnospiraceae bacterium]|nr:transcription-repair coupling factor [Lachnospiraceae bacterium]